MLRQSTFRGAGRSIDPPVCARLNTDNSELARTALVPVLVHRHSVPNCSGTWLGPAARRWTVRRLHLDDYQGCRPQQIQGGSLGTCQKGFKPVPPRPRLRWRD